MSLHTVSTRAALRIPRLLAHRFATPHRNSLVVAAALLACVARLSAAQPSVGRTLLDSAAAARLHHAAARTAVRANDLSRAQELLQQATIAWPLQPAYAVSIASIGARRGDIDAVVRSLTRLTQLEAGAELLQDTSVRSLADRNPTVQHVFRQWQVALQPVDGSRVYAELADSTIFPEGLAFDAPRRVTYVTSIRNRTIVAVHEDGSQRDVVPRDQPHHGAMMAVRIDRDGQHLWVTTVGLPSMRGYQASDSSMAALLRIRIADGAQTGRWEFGDNRQHVPGDIAIAVNGDVYVSDSRAPMLYRLRPGATRFDTITHPLFRSLQGMAITPDGTGMYLADYSHGLLRVDLANHAVQHVAGSDSLSTLGLDGIALHGASIVAVQNGALPARVVRYGLSSDGLAVTSARTIDRRPSLADEPTNGVVIDNDFVYIANSQWQKYDASGNRVLSQPLTPPRLLRVPIVVATLRRR